MKRKAGVVCSVAIVITMLLDSGRAPINRAGLELIGHAEACRTEPYICPAGYWTDGIGNTHGVTPGKSKTLDQIAREWGDNIRVAANCVRRQFNGGAMNENELAAFTSLAFRTGCYGMRTTYSAKLKRRVETKLHRYALAGDFKRACEEIRDFVSGGGVILPGLVARAKKEYALCTKPIASQ